MLTSTSASVGSDWPIDAARASHQRWRLLLTIATGTAISLAFTPAALVVHSMLDLRDVHIVYLVPVVIAATRYGLVSAMAAALCGTALCAYLFYAPIYSLLVFGPRDVISLTIFVIVAAITSHLSAVARASAAAAARNYAQLERLYSFSRKLTAVKAPEDIYAAIQDHASAVVGGRVTVVLPDPDIAAWEPEAAQVPEPVRLAMRADDASKDDGPSVSFLVSDEFGQTRWLVRRFPARFNRSGCLVVELSDSEETSLSDKHQRVDALLDEAIATFERLDIATTVAEAELRGQSERLREAVIGSTSHSLRTPLAAILGSASILTSAPAISDDARLSGLASIIVNEARRLDGDIHKMLDAATLSADGVKPNPTWVEPADLINAAVEAKRLEIANHRVHTDCPADLPLIRTDAAHAREALGLLIDNAARYSPAGSNIRISASPVDGMIALAVEDEGIGLDAEERTRLFEKFYRGASVRSTTRGSGLGLWIANSFVKASKGHIEIASPGKGNGTLLTIYLPSATNAEMLLLGDTDE